MRRRTIKRPRARTLALTLAVSALGSLALASPSFATAPASGAACQANDGKISGRGSTFQTNAIAAYIAGYTTDVCGPVANQYAGDPAGTNMLAYNYPNAAAGGVGTGSGNGQKAMSCRTDAFGGTDVPYFVSTLTQLDGAPGTISGCDISFAPPYTPTPNAGGPPFYPHSADSTANIMSFPVAGGAVGIAVHLATSGTCPSPPTSLQFSSLTMSHLFGGDYATWNAPDLVADNPSLAGCSTPITRVVRADKSGTTQTMKNYLNNVDGARTLCDGVSTWNLLAQDANNTVWPSGGTCVDSLVTASGTPALVAAVNATDGGVAYGDLSGWRGDSSVVLANLETHDSTVTGPAVYVSPGSFTAGSNCNMGAKGLPGSSNNDSVGLNASGATGAADARPNVSDITFLGTGYPICALTWDFVYTRLNNGSVSNPIAGLTADQRRTLYSFFTYVFSPAAQSRMAVQGYDPLPTTWLTKLRLGFQANF